MKKIVPLSQIKKLLVIICLAGLYLPLSADELQSIEMQDAWGIEPIHVRLTGAAYMIEFRYKILDAEKALMLSSRKRAEFPYLRAIKSKALLSVPYGPTVGFLKSNRRFHKLGKNYIAMFSNEGQHLLRGDKVKIQIKDQLSQELTVE
ncbi:MAG: hypothetical protein GY694_20815 [Gammaproteobacteria bacterium]|nr:hypothetical protein [Gammaproteobacteria bacterium]